MSDSRGDARTPRRRRGRPGKTSYSSIVEASASIVHVEGVDALTMRAVAERLGVTAMSLYHYFPDRISLISATLQYLLDQKPKPELKGTPRQRAIEVACHTVAIFDEFPFASELLETADEVIRPMLWTFDDYIAACEDMEIETEAACGTYLSLWYLALGVGAMQSFRTGARNKPDNRYLPWYMQVTQEDRTKYPNMAKVIDKVPAAKEAWSFRTAVTSMIDELINRAGNPELADKEPS